MSGKIRIKDIAIRAGVSVGTVDRVLHNRPNVSKLAREKVEKALQEMNYQPNMYASALAYNKSYNFYMILPRHEEETYWQEIEEGSMKACEARRDFSINVHIMHYERFEEHSFIDTYKKCLEKQPDGVVVVPIDFQAIYAFANTLHERHIPFILLDSYMPDLKPLTFYGQDSFSSGYFAAKILMLMANRDHEIMLMKQMKDGKIVSRQQINREVGFRNYMKKHYPTISIHEINLPLNSNKEEYDEILNSFFKKHPNIHHCITFNSKAHLVGEFLLKHKEYSVQIMGYDMVEKNAKCLKEGSISFLIAQHAYMQGYSCINSLFYYVVLKQKITAINYMPIELLTKENVNFYRRTQL